MAQKPRRARRKRPLAVIADLCIVPIGAGVSLSEYVSACYRIIQQSGLEHALHAYGTNVAGEYDTVMSVLRQCIEEVHAMGAPRVTCTVKLGTRVDRVQGMRDKVASVLARVSQARKRPTR